MTVPKREDLATQWFSRLREMGSDSFAPNTCKTYARSRDNDFVVSAKNERISGRNASAFQIGAANIESVGRTEDGEGDLTGGKEFVRDRYDIIDGDGINVLGDFV